MIEIEVDTLVDADVQATAGLYAEDGTLITTGLTFVSLTAGVSMLAITFPCPRNDAGGKAGPYDLRFFSMGGMSSGGLPRAPGVVAVTQPYLCRKTSGKPLLTASAALWRGSWAKDFELSNFREVFDGPNLATRPSLSASRHRSMESTTRYT